MVDRFEAEYEASTGTKLPPVAQTSPESDALAHESVKRIGIVASIVALFNGWSMARRTIVSCLMWFAVTFAFYGFNLWIPTLLVAQGYSLSNSFTFVLLFYIAQIPGYLSAAFLNDRLDRKWVSATYLLGGVVATLLMGRVHGPGPVIATGMLLSFCLTGVYASLYTLTPELYPTRIRATGNSFSTAVGRIGGIIAPNIIPVVLVNHGFNGVFILEGIVLLVAAIIIGIMGTSTSGHTLEELNETAHDPVPA